jgi:hypothetical protein
MKKIIFAVLVAGFVGLTQGGVSAYNACSDSYIPVCTSNGKTYMNPCYAIQDGEHISRYGKCGDNYNWNQNNWHGYQNWGFGPYYGYPTSMNPRGFVHQNYNRYQIMPFNGYRW